VSDILSEAADAVNERQGRYGTPADNMERIAALWTAYLEGRGLLDLERTDGVTATDCALMQALVKIARLEHGYHHDSVVDLAGYAACAAQINEVETYSSTEDRREARNETPARCPWRTGLGHCVLSALHPGDHVGERSGVSNETPSGSETSAQTNEADKPVVSSGPCVQSPWNHAGPCRNAAGHPLGMQP